MGPEDPKYDKWLKQAILDYLNENPDAMESVNAIAEWWIERRLIRVELEALRRVLKEMTDSGLLREVEIRGEIYCRLANKEVN